MFWVQKYEKNKISLAFAMLIFAKLFTSYALVPVACIYFIAQFLRVAVLKRVFEACAKWWWMGVLEMVLARRNKWNLMYVRGCKMSWNMTIKMPDGFVEIAKPASRFR